MRKRAFISYAHAQAAWVRTFHEHLELVLGKGSVALDEIELKPGRSFIHGLALALEKAEKLVLVATPEAAASSWVQREVRSKQLGAASFEAVGRILVVRLADTEMPDFLDDVQWIDFRDHDEATYRQRMAELAAAIDGGPVADWRLPDGIAAPEAPQRALPADLRRRAVELLASELADENKRLSFPMVLGIEPALVSSDAQTTKRGAASALLVHATRKLEQTLPSTFEGAARTLRAKARLLEILLERGLVSEDRRPTLETLSCDIEAHREARAALRATSRAPKEAPPPLEPYLEKVKRDRLYSPFLRAEAAFAVLDRIYAPLAHTWFEAEGTRLRDDERLVLPDACTLRELLGLALPKPTQPAHRWLILGDPGSGKTTQMRRLALDLAREDGAPWIPVFARLPQWIAAGKNLIPWVAEEARVGLASGRVEAALAEAAAAGRVLFLLDGLDEVPKDERERAVTEIRALADDFPSPIVVASRKVGKAPLGGDFAEVEVQPLDRLKQIAFLTSWFEARDEARSREQAPASRAATLVDLLEKDADLRELAGNPLYLTFIALLERDAAALEGGRAALYGRVLRLLLYGEHRPHLRPIEEPDLVEEILQMLAWQHTEVPCDEESLGPLRRRLRKDDDIAKRLAEVPRWRDDAQVFLDDVSEQTSILGPHDRADAWRYWHRTLREALTAQVLRQQHEREGSAPIVARARSLGDDDKNAWAEPIALVAGLIDPPDDLVLSLTEAHADVALRALGAVRSLAPETITTLFRDTFRNSWRLRSAVLMRIPALVAEPGEALDLIDQLRSNTRDGNDLFFLDHAITGVGARHPEAQNDADDLRQRLFDHVPMPEDVELYQSFVRPDGTREALWRRIEPVTGVIGSPEGVERDVERPQHRVEIVAPYCLGAVPVTREQYRAFDPDRAMYEWDDVNDEATLFRHPAIGLTWYEAMAFCRWLDRRVGLVGARLPTEEEWEYACRAGSETAFWFGDDESELETVAWFGKGWEEGTAPVGGRRANPFGLYDVHGNVWEWTASPSNEEWYAGRTTDLPLPLDPRQAPADFAAPLGVWRVLRGGSCRLTANGCRSAVQGHRNPVFGDQDLGFRVLLPRPPEIVDVLR